MAQPGSSGLPEELGHPGPQPRLQVAEAAAEANRQKAAQKREQADAKRVEAAAIYDEYQAKAEFLDRQANALVEEAKDLEQLAEKRIQEATQLMSMQSASSQAPEFPLVLGLDADEGSLSCTTVTMLKDDGSLPRVDELGLGMPLGVLPDLGQDWPKKLVAMHVIPHNVVKKDGKYRDCLLQVMRSKIGRGTWDARAGRLLEVLAKIKGAKKETEENMDGTWVNDMVRDVAAYLLGRLGHERDISKQKADKLRETGSDAPEVDPESNPGDALERYLQSERRKAFSIQLAKLDGLALEDAQQYDLMKREWEAKEELTEHDMLQAFLSVVDSEANILTTHRLYEVMWDCALWCPVWDQSNEVPMIFILPHTTPELDRIFWTHSRRYADHCNIDVGEADIILRQWYEALKLMDEKPIAFPGHVFKSILAFCAHGRLAARGIQGPIKRQKPASSPILELWQQRKLTSPATRMTTQTRAAASRHAATCKQPQTSTPAARTQVAASSTAAQAKIQPSFAATEGKMETRTPPAEAETRAAAAPARTAGTRPGFKSAFGTHYKPR